MNFDEDSGAGGFSNMGGFGGGNGGSFSFKMNGQDMGGMNPNDIFKMFMGGGMGGFGGMEGM